MAFGAFEAAAQLTVALTPSDYNGYHLTCFGGRDGAIEAMVSGGVAPYTYRWSNGGTTQNIADLASGYYRLIVTDALGEAIEAEVTLVEPSALRLHAMPFKYPSGFNVSCTDCFNGSIDVSVEGGVAPFAYDWGDEVFTEDRSGLGALVYQIAVEDANGCNVQSERIALTQPERSDWNIVGNANTNPALNYIGTSDQQPLVFRTNNQERLSLLSDGFVRMPSLSGSITGLLVADGNGTLKRYSDGDFPEVPIGCPAHDRLPWLRCGNTVSYEEYLGTNNNRSLIIKTNAQFRMVITAQGRVGLGQPSPVHQFEVTHADASGGMVLRNALSGNAHNEIRFYQGATQRWGLGCDLNSNGGQDFFLWDEVAQSPRIYVNGVGKVGIGTMPPANSNSLYRLYVGDGIATRDVRVTQASNWPDYVFAPEYRPLPLAELRRYVQENRHMPGLPSEHELKLEGGYELGAMQAKLLKLVEEQTLYILQLEERLARLEAICSQPAKP